MRTSLRGATKTAVAAGLATFALIGFGVKSAEAITVETVAGGGPRGDAAPARFYDGGGVPREAHLNLPTSLSATYNPETGELDGGFLIANTRHHQILKVDKEGHISVAAGNGNPGWSADPDPAVRSNLNTPFGVTARKDGSFVIADTGNKKLRNVDPKGIMTTIPTEAEIKERGICLDPEDPTKTLMWICPNGIAAYSDGSILRTRPENHTIEKLKMRLGGDGVVYEDTITVAGVPGQAGNWGNEFYAQNALLNFPVGVAILPDNRSFVFTDNQNDAVRLVNENGEITKIAGSGTRGFNVERGTSGEVNLNGPSGIAVLGPKKIVFSDTLNNRVRLITLD